MKLTIPQISVQERGRNYTDRNYVYHNFFDSPLYGGLHRKHEDYNERHIFINELLRDIYSMHVITIKEGVRPETHSFQHAHYRMLFMIESVIYWLRKNIDEMIGFNYYSYYFQLNGTEPHILEISSIGALINKKDHDLHALFSAHIDKLDRINEVSNTFKHSFIASEAHSLIGKDEPVVNCLDMRRNNTVNEPKWHSYFLREIIEDYVAFFTFSRETLKQFKLPEKRSGMQ